MVKKNIIIMAALLGVSLTLSSFAAYKFIIPSGQTGFWCHFRVYRLCSLGESCNIKPGGWSSQRKSSKNQQAEYHKKDTFYALEASCNPENDFKTSIAQTGDICLFNINGQTTTYTITVKNGQILFNGQNPSNFDSPDACNP